nr:uncharacterized protein LOC124816385 [Hydra vulgaris]
MSFDIMLKKFVVTSFSNSGTSLFIRTEVNETKMPRSTRLKTKAYLFEEEHFIENLPEIMFSTNKDINLYFQFRRSGDKIAPTKKLIACTIGHQTAKCSGLGSCPKNCIMFAVKKPWIDGGYEDGILTDPFIRKHITDLINSRESLKKSKCKNSKEAGKARQDFKKKKEIRFSGLLNQISKIF